MMISWVKSASWLKLTSNCVLFMFCLFADSMASNVSFVAKLNAWKKAVKNSRHVTGSLRDELYLLSDLYNKLALCSLKLYKFDFGNDEEIVFQAGEILSGCAWSKGNIEETDLRGFRQNTDPRSTDPPTDPL